VYVTVSSGANALLRNSACTEVYYILEGRGKMELNDDVIDVEPGTVVYIEPYTRHRLYSKEGVRTIVVGVPAYRLDDEFYET
jgi:mannose-6-phosphate isomerase-like protein (cupin superfamily)